MKTNCDKCGGFIVMQGKYDYAGELCSCINASSIYGVIPKGWKLVPIEPRAEMLKAAQRAEMDKSALFEYWSDTDYYADSDIQRTWRGWQACSESMQAEMDKRDAMITKIDFELSSVNSILYAAKFVLAEADKANARIAQLQEALKAISTFPRYEMPADMAKKALSGFSDTWLSQHDKAVEVKVLEEIIATTQNMTLIPHAAFGQLYQIIEHMIESRK